MVRRCPPVLVLGRRDGVAIDWDPAGDRQRRTCPLCQQKIIPSQMNVHLQGCIAATRVLDNPRHLPDIGEASDGAVHFGCNMVWGGMLQNARKQLINIAATVSCHYDCGDFTVAPEHCGRLLGVGWNSRVGCWYGPAVGQPMIAGLAQVET